MNYQTTDEEDKLWEESQAGDATAFVDDEPDELVASATVQPTGEDGSDATPSDEDSPSPFDKNALFQEFTQHFEQNVLPVVRQQIIDETMNRSRQSMKARDDAINAKLAPVYRLLEQQVKAGYLTEDDAAQQYRAEHQRVSQEQVAQEEQAQKAQLYQQWLAQQQPAQVPEYAKEYEADMQAVLDNSTLEEGDPELEQLATKITDPDPERALKMLERRVATLEKQKQTRLAREAKPKKDRTGAFVDMGTGGGASSGNPLAGIDDEDELWDKAKASMGG